MSTEQYQNLPVSTATGSLDNTTNPITLVVATGTGSTFPATTNGPFRITVSDATGTNAEVMLVTTRATDTMTAYRGTAIGSFASAEVPVPTLTTHSAGSIVSHNLTAGAMNQIKLDWGIFPYNFTDPTKPTFSWRNQGTATLGTSGKSLFLLAPTSAGDNIRGQEISAPSTPWSITIAMAPLIPGALNNYALAGLYVSDGTKLVTAAVSNANYGSLAGFGVATFSSVSAYNSTVSAPGISLGLPFLILKVLNDGTNLKWYTSIDGTNFVLLYTSTVTNYLSAASFVGWMVNCSNSTYPAAAQLLSWAQGTS